MNANLDKIAQELYGKIQTRFPGIKIGDENAEVLSTKQDIPNARFFEFDYEEDGESLGTIAITLDEDDGIVVQLSDNVANQNVIGHGLYKFIKSFREFAKNRLLNFDVQNIGKSNLDKRDYQFQAKRKEFPMMESKLFGTSKVSYQDLGEARLIIKHNQHINPDLPAGRTMHIESIYIQNAEGERFKYPYKHLNGARALAEHIKHGGHPYDGIGKHITGLSEELAHLRKFKGFVGRQPMISETMGPVTDKVVERIEEIKKEIQHLQRPAFYETFAESFEEREEQIIPEDIINDLVDRLTIRTFNEELKAAFPYIYKFLDETDMPIRELSTDDFLSETDVEETTKAARSEYDIGESYESFMDYIINENKDELFSPLAGTQNRAIEELNKLLSTELTGGLNSALSLKGIIDDPELIEKVRVLNNDIDIRREIKDYILDRDPKIFPRLEFPEQGTEIGGADVPSEEPPPPPMPEPAAEPAPEPMPEPAPEQPAPATAPEVTPMAESQGGSAMRSMLQYIAGFYNKEHQNFPLGGMRVKIKVKKEFEDGMFPHATADDLKKILRFIDMKDPSSDAEQQTFESILKLAGIKK